MQNGGRGPLWAAAVFIVLFVAGVLVVSALPKSTASADEVQRYLASHQGAVRGSVYLLVLAGVPYLILLAALRRRLGAMSNLAADTSFGGGLVLAAMTTVVLLVELALALRAGQISPGTARVLLDVVQAFGPIVTGAVFALVAPVAVATLRTNLLPRWVGLLSAGYATYEIVESLTVFGDHGAFSHGGPVNFVGALVFVAWIIAIGVGLSQPVDTPAVQPTVAETQP